MPTTDEENSVNYWRQLYLTNKAQTDRMEEMATEMEALRVDVSYWADRYRLAKIDKDLLGRAVTEASDLKEEVKRLKAQLTQSVRKEFFASLQTAETT
jgi:hypothetical protein